MNPQNPVARLFGKTIRLAAWPVVAFMLSMVASCITVNVNFPESAVQQAANDFVKDLYTPDAASGKPVKHKKSKKEAPAAETETQSLFVFGRVSVAFAMEDIRTDSPKVLKIREKLSARLADLNEWKTKGNIGEAEKGLVGGRELDKLDSDTRKKVKKIIEEENDDRDDLYVEIRKANSMNDPKEKKIRQFFGGAFKVHSPKGTWIQDDEGNWTKKK